jgi:hypothetical protein
MADTWSTEKRDAITKAREYLHYARQLEEQHTDNSITGYYLQTAIAVNIQAYATLAQAYAVYAGAIT